MMSTMRTSPVIAGVALTLLVFLLVGCSTGPRKSNDFVPPQRTLEDAMPVGEASAVDKRDPFEGFNRQVYRFNAWFDDAILLPLVDAYDFVFPEFVKTGVFNFMRNVDEIPTLLNAVLQLKPKASAHTAGRLLINTTVGLLGVLDPASEMGLVSHDEDFGQTLGYYGVGSGPYLVLPILGPSSVRDGIGIGVDAYAFNDLDPLYFDKNDGVWRYGYYVHRVLDTRRSIGFRYYDSGSPFEYELVRMLYLKMRKLQIAR